MNNLVKQRESAIPSTLKIIKDGHNRLRHKRVSNHRYNIFQSTDEAPVSEDDQVIVEENYNFRDSL